MKRSRWRPRLAALLTALCVSVGLLGLSTAPAWAAAGTVTEFSVKSSPSVITAGPDGNLWFTEEVGNQVGRISTAGTLTEFPVGIEPVGITAGPDGNLWFTVLLGNFIGRITPTGSMTEFPIPTANSRSEGITAGPDGNVWFAESLTSQIGRITTS